MTTYEVRYNQGCNGYVCAMTYVEAKDLNEAYALANAQRCGNEHVYSVEVFKPIALL